MDDIKKFLESQDITKSYQTVSDDNFNDVSIESLLIAFKEQLFIQSVSNPVCHECGSNLNLGIAKRLLICENDECDYNKRANDC